VVGIDDGGGIDIDIIPSPIIDMLLLLVADEGLGVVGTEPAELELDRDPLFSPVSRRLLCCSAVLSSVRSRLSVGGVGRARSVGVPGALVDPAFPRLGLVVLVLEVLIAIVCFRMLISSVNVDGSLA
jgi:hypothetical protein